MARVFLGLRSKGLYFLPWKQKDNRRQNQQDWQNKEKGHQEKTKNSVIDLNKAKQNQQQNMTENKSIFRNSDFYN